MKNQETSLLDSTSTDRPGGLLAWQWSNYGAAHKNRSNLAIHALSAPFFILGGVAILASVSLGWWLAIAGAAALLAVIAAQGRGHAQETGRPAPFRGPMDAVLRIFAEQWLTFPRFVLSGRFRSAWRAADAGARVAKTGKSSQ